MPEPDVPQRSSGGRFSNVTVAGGFGHLQKGHGIACGDIDFDGDQDIYAVMGGAYPADVAYDALYLNPGGANHWITLELEGVTGQPLGHRVAPASRGRDGRRAAGRVRHRGHRR